MPAPLKNILACNKSENTWPSQRLKEINLQVLYCVFPQVKLMEMTNLGLKFGDIRCIHVECREHFSLLCNVEGKFFTL
jgi:hypothetical protein